MTFIANVLSFLKPRRKLQVVRRDVCRISPQQWRADPGMVQMAQQVLRDERVQLMLDCVYFAHPANILFGQMSLEDRALMQAQSQGYTIALACLRSLGSPERAREDLGEPTFEPPEETTENAA